MDMVLEIHEVLVVTVRIQVLLISGRISINIVETTALLLRSFFRVK